MQYDAFEKSLSEPQPPGQWSPLLKALWHERKGDWHIAHELAQEVNTRDGSWIHAYLHRKEGDQGNAGYWYHKAGRVMPSISLDAEWEAITRELLQRI